MHGDLRSRRICFVAHQLRCGHRLNLYRALENLIGRPTKFSKEGLNVMKKARLLFVLALLVGASSSTAKGDAISNDAFITTTWAFACVTGAFCEPDDDRLLRLFYAPGVELIGARSETPAGRRFINFQSGISNIQ